MRVQSFPDRAGPPSLLDPGRWRAGTPWPGRAELRADLRGSLVLAGILVLAGGPAGLLWWALAPRAVFEVGEEGPVPVGRLSDELLVAGDGVYTLVLAGLGLLAGLVAWRLRRRRGVAVLLALAAGMTLAALAAWQLGEYLAPRPTEAELAAVGTRLLTPVRLNAPAALAVGPFLAVLAYVVAALLAPSEDLDRPAPPPTGVPVPRAVDPVHGPAPSVPGAGGRGAVAS